MAPIRRNIVKHLLLLSTLWITFVAPVPFEINGGIHVPEIDGCGYVNAYYATCWWRRPEGDSCTVFRLGYTTDADHPHERREKYCETTRQKDEHGVIIESCGIHGTIYQRFTFWVGSVQDCDVATASCVTSHRSTDLLFTCTKENVKLTIPPGSLNIDEDGRRLTWERPEKELSMLSFVMHSRKVIYKVEHLKILTETETIWEEWYRGYETNVFLPTLIPGTTYEARVSASLDSPSTPSRVATSSDREWTEPSNVLVFMVPRTMKITSEITVIEIKERKDSSGATNSTVGDVIRPLPVSEQVIAAAVGSSFIVVLILVMVCYFLPWNKWCCKLDKTKDLKPKTFLDFTKSEESLSTDEAEEIEKSERHSVKERVYSITDELDRRYDIPTHTQSTLVGTVFALLKKESDSPEYARQRFFSSTNYEQEFSLSDTLNRVPILENDVTSVDDVTVTNNTLQGENNSSTSRRGSLRYVTFGQECQESGMPSFLMTSESDGLTSPILDRSESEYVVDDTGINVTDVTSFEEYEEKQKQWQKYMMNQSTSSDDVSDYVLQTPTFTKDFSRDMTMFISMVTEDIANSEPSNNYDDTIEPVLLRDDKMSLLSDDKDAAGKRDSCSCLVIMKVCPSCKTSQNHDNRPNEQTKNNVAGETTNRRGSASQNSIDSGYSPDAQDCALLPTEKDSLLPERLEIKSNVEIRDEESSDNEDDYMTYVTT